MTRLFRRELFVQLSAHPALAAIRPAHLPVFANITSAGKRLSELAEDASMSLSSMQELVDELQQRGLVERQPDPHDKRAKRIVLTAEGRAALTPAASITAALERDYANRIGKARFEEMCLALNDLIDELLADERK
jgi:DNA-binding MarR family transcriptional regulator